MQADHVNLLDQLALFTELRVSSQIFGRILQTFFFYKISHFFEKKNKQKRSVISQNFFSKMQN